jgi:putative redox protein
MTTVRHISRAVGSTGSAAPRYRVEVRVGQHHLVADEPTVNGGADFGPSPFDLVMSGLTACTATTLRMYATRKGWDVESIEVEVRYDVADDGRRAIARTITLPDDVLVEQRQRLAEVAEQTPVTVAIREGTPITTTFRSPTA